VDAEQSELEGMYATLQVSVLEENARANPVVIVVLLPPCWHRRERKPCVMIARQKELAFKPQMVMEKPRCVQKVDCTDLLLLLDVTLLEFFLDCHVKESHTE
jgi:hypothetical protein